MYKFLTFLFMLICEQQNFVFIYISIATTTLENTKMLFISSLFNMFISTFKVFTQKSSTTGYFGLK